MSTVFPGCQSTSSWPLALLRRANTKGAERCQDPFLDLQYPSFGPPGPVSKFACVPPWEHDIKDFLRREHGVYAVAKLTFKEARFIRTFSGEAQLQKDAIWFLNTARTLWIMPNIPFLSRWVPETFGSHCVRWTEAFQSKLVDLPLTSYPKTIHYRQFTLRYPVAGGPVHSVILLRPRIGGKVWGLDNTGLGKVDHIFDPLEIINDPKYPAEMREDLRKDVDEMKPK